MIDLYHIADTLGFELEDIEILTDIFLDNAKESLEILNTALEKEDFKQIIYAAHAIRGSALNLMFEEVVTIALKIEQFAKNETSTNYDLLYKELKEQIELLEIQKTVQRT